MGKVDNVYEDQWGTIIDRPGDGFVEIRWFDTTVAFDAEQFQAFLGVFAGVVEAHRGRAVLVDATSFEMDRKHMNAAWRDANIIPRYNAAGVRKFAFHMPKGMPLNGQAPTREGPGQFLTGYFATRRDALAWIAQ